MNQSHCLRSLALLPAFIDYAGFRFRPMLHFERHLGFGFGYILTDCLSKKKYKKDVFKNYGVWDENSPTRRLSSTGSDYLFFMPLLTLEDEEFQHAIKTVFASLTRTKMVDPDQPALPVSIPEF